MSNIQSIKLKTKELLTYLCGYHGNLVIIATRYVADAYCPKEAPRQILSQYDLRQRCYKVRKLMSPFQLAKLHGTTSCLSEVHFVIESTSCYQHYLLLSTIPLVIGTTSCYRKHLLLSGPPLVIGTTSCYQKHLLLSGLPLVIGNTACYRKAFCQAQSVIPNWLLICPGDRSVTVP